MANHGRIVSHTTQTMGLYGSVFKELRLAKGLSLRDCARELSKHTTCPISHVKIFNCEDLATFEVDEEVWQAIKKVLGPC